MFTSPRSDQNEVKHISSVLAAGKKQNIKEKASTSGRAPLRSGRRCRLRSAAVSGNGSAQLTGMRRWQWLKSAIY